MLGLGLGLTSEGSLRRAGGSVPWTPLDLGASLKAWWDADDHGTARMTDDGAGLISSWTDRVSAIAVTGTTTQRPTWAAASFNSAYAGLTFDGSVNALVSTSIGALPTGATAGEIWGIASNTVAGSIAAGKSMAAYGDTAGVTRAIFRVGVSNVSRAQASNITIGVTDTVIDWTGPHIVGGNWAGTTQGGRVDGRDFNPATGVMAALATAATRLRLGGTAAATPAGGTYWTGVIRQALITLTLSGTEREKLEGWLAWDVGLASLLPVGHPYKSAAP